MMIRFTCLAFAVIIALPVLAEGQPPEPPPKPEPPRVDRPEDGDSITTPHQSRADMPCCIRDGVILFHAPLGLMRDRTRAFCAAMNVVPECKAWRMK